MTVATLRGPTRTAPRPARRSARTIVEAPSPQTLDHLIGRMWSDLTSHVTVACPVCEGPMKPRYGAGSGAVGGRCTDCGTTIG